MIELPDLVAGGLAAGTLSALALAGGLLRLRRQQTRQHAEIAALRTQLDGTVRAFTAEVEHLAAHRVPAAARQVAHPHLEVPGPLQPLTVGTPLGIALENVLLALQSEVVAQRTRVDAAAQAGMRGATREIQAALYRLQDALRVLQQRYDEPELAQTLFRLDHENEQSLRRAQVTAVVCGAWVGLAREESHVVDAVTGGQARLPGYQRVRVHNHLEPGTALVSHAVEPVAIIVAELLDNALRHSSPDTEVVVSLQHVHHGVCVTVDDAGLGMTRDERDRAQRLVAGKEPILLTALGDPPRMGLAAIGRLTRQFDLGVDVSSASPYGGVRAVLRIDSHLLSRIDPELRPPSASAPRTTRRAAPERPAPAHTYGSEDPVLETAAGHHGAPEADGLPQRRRRTRAVAQEAPAAPTRPARRPEEAAAALGALQSGTAAARSGKSEATAPETADAGPAAPVTPDTMTAATGAADAGAASPGAAIPQTFDAGPAVTGAAGADAAIPVTADAGAASTGAADAGATSTDAAIPQTFDAGPALTGAADADAAIPQTFDAGPALTGAAGADAAIPMTADAGAAVAEAADASVALAGASGVHTALASTAHAEGTDAHTAAAPAAHAEASDARAATAGAADDTDQTDHVEGGAAR
ncbi:ATP-binding protein [Streptomyces sp. NPDC001388]|uniref:ATP-binding protein n=1 Tax=Streptomyces sp. NPDC001388 TaxID=3364568 RepID=UPI0036BF6D0F